MTLVNLIDNDGGAIIEFSELDYDVVEQHQLVAPMIR